MKPAFDKKKTDMYDELVKSLTLANTGQWANVTEANQFILAYYKASACASDDVIQACSLLLTPDVLTNLISNIYNAVRKDVNRKAKTFNFRAFSAFK